MIAYLVNTIISHGQHNPLDLKLFFHHLKRTTRSWGYDLNDRLLSQNNRNLDLKHVFQCLKRTTQLCRYDVNDRLP